MGRCTSPFQPPSCDQVLPDGPLPIYNEVDRATVALMLGAAIAVSLAMEGMERSSHCIEKRSGVHYRLTGKSKSKFRMKCQSSGIFQTER
jgi:hypothetical protein